MKIFHVKQNDILEVISKELNGTTLQYFADSNIEVFTEYLVNVSAKTSIGYGPSASLKITTNETGMHLVNELK